MPYHTTNRIKNRYKIKMTIKTPDKLKGLDMEVIMENKTTFKLNTTNIAMVKPIKTYEYKIKLY